jgi:hypothetical protein
LLVRVLPSKVKVLVVDPVSSGSKFKGELATPFTVVTKFDPDKDVELVLIIGLVLETTPLTVVVRLFPVVVVVLVVKPVKSGNKSKADPVTPLTVVVRLEPVRVLDTVVPAFIADCKSWVDTTPFTVEVRLVPDNVRALVVDPVNNGKRFKGAEATPFTVVTRFDPDKDVELVFIKLTVPSDTPLTLPDKVLPVEVKAPELIIG